MKLCIHKWSERDRQPKYSYLQCVKCGKKKVKEVFKGGFQPMKHIDWK
jgi:hypothetical protein